MQASKSTKITEIRQLILYNKIRQTHMTSATVQLPGLPFKDWVRDIYLHRKTGLLSVSEQPAENLFFIAGDLYLGPEHLLFDSATEWSSTSGSFKALALDILEAVGPPDAAKSKFREGAAQIRIDLVGPLPTSQLIMEVSIWDSDESALLRQLDGEETVLVAASSGEPLPSSVDLDPHEAFLLSRLESPQAVGELLHQLDIERATHSG